MRTILAILLFPALLSAQVLPDQVWVLGTQDPSGLPGYGNAILRFQDGQVIAETAVLRMNFESTTAAMPDSLGQLLFYTNGCHIANRLGDTMLNGAGLNPGEMADWTCPTSGYVAPLGAMALPMPGSNRFYYLFHMGVRYEPEKKLRYGPFYYTVIDMSLEGGKGAVISKNNVLADGRFEPFSAVRHGNGRDWWLVFPEYEKNRYHRILFSSAGIQQVDYQEIGDTLACRYIGSSAFSPNGARYARQQHCGVMVMDFDRCAGQFSNARAVKMPPRAILGGGIAFNKDGSRLLVATQVSIQEADLTKPIPVLDTIVPINNVAGSSLLLMQYAPDGKIYLNNLGRTKAYHVLNTPNEADLGFIQRGLTLPVFCVRSLPNYPNFRLYDVPGSLCDTLGINAPIVSVTTSDPATEAAVYPNPFSGQLNITLDAALYPALFSLYDLSGRLVLRKKLSSEKQEITGLKLPAGAYLWEIQTDDGRMLRGKVIGTGF